LCIDSLAGIVMSLTQLRNLRICILVVFSGWEASQTEHAVVGSQTSDGILFSAKL
jgi:hypothetical protein